MDKICIYNYFSSAIILFFTSGFAWELLHNKCRGLSLETVVYLILAIYLFYYALRNLISPERFEKNIYKKYLAVPNIRQKSQMAFKLYSYITSLVWFGFAVLLIVAGRRPNSCSDGGSIFSIIIGAFCIFVGILCIIKPVEMGFRIARLGYNITNNENKFIVKHLK